MTFSMIAQVASVSFARG